MLTNNKTKQTSSPSTLAPSPPAPCLLPLVLQDAEDARKLIEAEGSETMLISADLSEGENVCEEIVKQASLPHCEAARQCAWSILLWN